MLRGQAEGGVAEVKVLLTHSEQVLCSGIERKQWNALNATCPLPRPACQPHQEAAGTGVAWRQVARQEVAAAGRRGRML